MNVNNILNLKVISIDRQSAVNHIETKLKSLEHHKIAFVNANLANLSVEDSNLRKILQSFTLLNDGAGMDIAAKLLNYKPFKENLNGTDFTPYFLDNTTLKLNVFLLGSREPVVERSVSLFKKKWPQHHVVGYHNGFFDDHQLDQIFLKIKNSKPDIVFIGMGNPIQEKIANMIVPKYALSAWCVGACFEFISNQLPRAPKWMRKLRIEWIYRLILEPKRLWKRYLIGNFIFIYNIAKQRIGS